MGMAAGSRAESGWWTPCLVRLLRRAWRPPGPGAKVGFGYGPPARLTLAKPAPRRSSRTRRDVDAPESAAAPFGHP
eukprot:scaffold1_cov402-Prasinococcus_capsulatus_cf.AAC.21